MSSLKVETESDFAPSTGTKPYGPVPQLVKQFTKRKSKPKPKIKPKTILQRVFGNKNVVKEHYFTSGANVNEENQRNLLTEPSPFHYPQDLEEFSYKVMSKAWRDNLRRKEQNLKYNVRNNYRTRQQMDILNRLFVKEPPEVQTAKTICDIDPEFFTIVEGRPVAQKLDMRKYVSNVRNILRTKIVTGYREDDIALIEENLIIEQTAIDDIRSEFQKYVDTFEEFLANDHRTSMELLRKAEKAAAVCAEKYETIKEISKQVAALRSSVYNLEEKWRTCKMYQKFLYLISPMSWRKVYDFYYRKQQGKALMCESSVFGRYRLSSMGDALSLEQLIEQFLDDIHTQEEPILYFTAPNELLKVYRFIEVQNLNSLLYSEDLAVPLENVNMGMLEAREKFDEEMNYLQEIVDNLEGGILWEEERAHYLEQLAMELLNGEFKVLTSHEEVLNMYVFVEDVYESRIAPNDANLSVRDMMTAVELNYHKFLLQLDRLPQATVYRAESSCYAEEAKTMKIAEEAAKKVVQIERLSKRLQRVLEPPPVRISKDLKWRSPPYDPPRHRDLGANIPTAKETEYFTFFADFCQHTDDPKELEVEVTVEGV